MTIQHDNPPALMGWRDHILAGEQYLKTAHSGLARRVVFNNPLLVQISAMAIEKLLVGLSYYYGRMPTDHTLSGLVTAMDRFCPLDTRLSTAIRQLDRWENLCTLTPRPQRLPDDHDMETWLNTAQQLADFARSRLPTPTV